MLLVIRVLMDSVSPDRGIPKHDVYSITLTKTETNNVIMFVIVWTMCVFVQEKK